MKLLLKINGNTHLILESNQRNNKKQKHIAIKLNHRQNQWIVLFLVVVYCNCYWYWLGCCYYLTCHSQETYIFSQIPLSHFNILLRMVIVNTQHYMIHISERRWYIGWHVAVVLRLFINFLNILRIVEYFILNTKLISIFDVEIFKLRQQNNFSYNIRSEFSAVCPIIYLSSLQ